MNRITILLFIAAAIYLSSCVPARQYQDAVNQRDACYKDSAQYAEQVRMKEVEIKELNKRLTVNEDSLRYMTKDLADLQYRYDATVKANQELRDVEATLNNRINQLLALSSSENQQLNEDLTKRERDLQLKTADLEKQKRNIDSLQSANVAKEKRIAELENAINDMNKKLTDVMTSVEKALSGFNSSDLTIENKNGRIYVKMSEKLLFASGSTTVDTKGKQALKSLADALKQQKDIQILVEGHTDNVPLTSASFPKDNWDLSVLRATTIVKILTKDYGMDPTMVEASGKGEYLPIAANTDATGRATNRRTEIIIIPNLEAITNILKTLNQ